jgi:L-alanine-DL-glutamate epimerase-like enolase superfamily enzyme
VEARVEKLDVSVHTVPTDSPESDGTMEWDSTTIVVVEAHGAGRTGLGYTYTAPAAGALIDEKLRDVVEGSDVFALAATWLAMGAAVRNVGRPGLAMCAVSAVDTALWDLKARVLSCSLVNVLPRYHDSVLLYGSGGFCTYGPREIAEQLGGWAGAGIPRVKMKVGRDPAGDPERIAAARRAAGEDAELYVDANGAFAAKEAVRWAHRYAEDWNVTWFEEPVSSADLEGLRLVREHATLDVAAGEYAYTLADARNLIGCVDCLQLDVTRCGGITGLLQAAALAAAHGLEVSGHCAPQLSAHGLCAVPNLRHLEYFHDHVRVESMLFDGVLEPVDGALVPDRSRDGHGLVLKRAEAQRWAA